MKKEPGIKNIGTNLEPNWVVTVYLWNKEHTKKTKRRVSGIRNKSEALRIRDELKVNLRVERACPQPPEKDPIKTFEECCDLYFAHSEGNIGEYTLHQYRTSLNAIYLPHWRHRDINSIKHDDVKRRLAEAEIERKWNPGGKKFNLRVIKNIFTYCQTRGFYQGFNPCDGIKVKVPPPQLVRLTKDQANLLLRAARETNHSWFPVWFTALNTGCRSGELIALQWGKIDFARNQILINLNWNSKAGYKSPKSGHERTLDMSPPLKKLLLEMKMKRGNVKSTDYVLADLHPTIKSDWAHGYQAKVLQDFIAVSGIDLPKVTFHSLRATWCTTMLQAGIPETEVRKMGGWSDRKAFEKYINWAGIRVAGITRHLGLDGGVVEGMGTENAEVIQLTVG